jgi:hypothetical protein
MGMTRFRREDTLFYKRQRRNLCDIWKNLYATSAKEEAQSIVSAALAKLENLTSVRQSAYAFAA